MVEKKINIAVFAYNEENSIENAIRSIYESLGDSIKFKTFVLANGCVDNTVEIVRNMTNHYPGLSVVEIEMGDKCNAWNTYVYDYADDAYCHFFCDGDVTFSKGAFERMYDKLLENDLSFAVAGVPLSGRGRKKYFQMIKEKSNIFGNLYGLKNEFLKLVRSKNFKLPIGFLVDDNLIGRIICTDIDRKNKPNKKRVVYDEHAGYYVRSLNPFSILDAKIYINRLIRYKLGELQQDKLRPISYNDFPVSLDSINNEILADLKTTNIPISNLILRGVVRRLENKY